MCAKSASQENSPASVTPMVHPRMPWRVANVQPLNGYRLHVRFIDGLEGEVDMAALVASPGAGVFAALAEPTKFAQAYVEYGAVTWPGEIDLAPDAMYQSIKQNGKWILR
jgi:hypothetical protein